MRAASLGYVIPSLCEESRILFEILPYGRQNNNSNGCTEIGAAVARCGGGEIRTLVQTRKQYAFYMLISASVVGHIQDRSYQYAP